MKPFGCAAYAFIHDKQKEKGSNFDSKTHHCIMLCYIHQTMKIWPLWDMEKKKVIVSTDVIFDESLFPYRATKWHQQGQAAIPASILVPRLSAPVKMNSFAH